MSIPEKPEYLQVEPRNIPEALRLLPRWLLWRAECRGGKWTKPPYQANGRPASVSDPTTWTDFSEAMAAYEEGGFDGIGLVLTDEDDLCGIDLDHCVGDDCSIQQWARDIVRQVRSYSEISPSGSGLRIFCRGKLPAGRRKKGAVEMYSGMRFLSVTGHALDVEAMQ